MRGYPIPPRRVPIADPPGIRRQLAGVIASREVNFTPSGVGEHRHDTVALTVPLLGGLSTIFEEGQCWIGGSSAVIHPVGAAHGGVINETGLEAVEFDFDAAWLRHWDIDFTLDRTRCVIGGRAGAAALALARRWISGPELSEARLAEATKAFIELALTEETPPNPRWLAGVQRAVAAEDMVGVRALAAKLGLNAAWLGQAYKGATGEGIQATLRRKRVEKAARLLRSTADPLAEIAITAGFCDQSHMTRCFRAVLARTPLQVREDSGYLHQA